MYAQLLFCRKQLKHSSNIFSRRRFLAVGTLGCAGLWASCSSTVSARTLRGLVADASRTMIVPKAVPTPASWNDGQVTAAWLGHASVLINFYGLKVITDPVLHRRIGADTPAGTIGPKRLVAPALSPDQLPDIDLVVLSHAHMDHLDHATLRDLPGRPRVVSAYGTADLLQHPNLHAPETLRWGERAMVRTGRGEIEVTAFEVKHWGARWRHDKHRGYNGYVLARGSRKLIFGGDTARTDSFRTLRSHGPIDAAIMPIGAYNPWVCSHCTPEEALAMTDDAGAEHFLPIHFKTFPFGQEDRSEPLRRLQAAINPQRIGWKDIGETLRLS
jgi:L-ascorbate metabolism protein UlaG (beta-lactamase superfamily)